MTNYTLKAETGVFLSKVVDLTQNKPQPDKDMFLESYKPSCYLRFNVTPEGNILQQLWQMDLTSSEGLWINVPKIKFPSSEIDKVEIIQ